MNYIICFDIQRSLLYYSKFIPMYIKGIYVTMKIKCIYVTMFKHKAFTLKYHI